RLRAGPDARAGGRAVARRGGVGRGAVSGGRSHRWRVRHRARLAPPEATLSGVPSSSLETTPENLMLLGLSLLAAVTLVSQSPNQSPRRAADSSSPPVPKRIDRKSTRLNSSHDQISYAVFCLKKKK